MNKKEEIEKLINEHNGVKASNVQVGGSHYKHAAIQPYQFTRANDMGFLEGSIVKRAYRHDKPGGKGRQDIEKIIHECQLILEHDYSDKTGEKND